MTHDVALRDAELAALISRAESEASELLIVANTHTVRAAKRADTSSPWADIGRGDFDAACAEATRSLAKKGRLFWHTVQTSPSDVDLSVVPTIAANRDLVTQWVKTASQVSKPKNGGRGANPSPKDIDDYGNDAAWRCQFSGCGLNLLHHKATGSTNKSSYFAHIVASSKDGPRGGDRSHELSADINNFILLCDDCHRLIDRRDPEGTQKPFCSECGQRAWQRSEDSWTPLLIRRRTSSYSWGVSAPKLPTTYIPWPNPPCGLGKLARRPATRGTTSPMTVRSGGR